VECNPTVLVIGAGELGVGVDNLIKEKKIKVVESDVYFSSRNNLIADGHDLPFVNESFDAVVIQAVLEHVIDPYRCINEAYRVLKVDGLIYAETPFMYPVHLGPYDFTRFSLTGHRRLLRKFIEIDSGVASGPGQALALSIRSFVLSASTSVFVQAFATTILPFLIFWLKYCDYFLMSKPHAADFASTIFFLGKKRGRGISDEEVINTHWTKRRDLVRHTVLG
jgi:SAM-dependent methyltransferase